MITLIIAAFVTCYLDESEVFVVSLALALPELIVEAFILCKLLGV